MAVRAGFGVAAACLVGALLATSCDDGKDDSPTVLTLGEAPDALIEAYCERFADCGCMWNWPPSPEECRAQVHEEIEDLRERGEQFGLTFDGTCLGALVDALDDRGCGQNEASTDDTECVRPCFSYHGNGGIGDKCTDYGSFNNCGQGLRCDTESGRCEDPCRRGELGQSCAGDRCIDTLVCDFENDRCVEGPGPGKECASYGCAVGSICDFNDNVCKQLPSQGEACLNGSCAEDLFCITDPIDPTMSVCSGQADDGEACMGHAQCKSLNCPAGFCRPQPGKGEDCAGSCDRGLECDFETMKCVDAAPAICTDQPL
ncbi:MAG TPA: hypothetical protein VFG69_06805 [Nannocystaceae bacterium]|nr:hypothetical protein [Nannocystaceae bacterium]